MRETELPNPSQTLKLRCSEDVHNGRLKSSKLHETMDRILDPLNVLYGHGCPQG